MLTSHTHLSTNSIHSNTSRTYRESCGHRRSARHQNTMTTTSTASQRDAREGGRQKETERTEEMWTDLEYRACGRAHLSVGILWILLNMRSRRLRMRMRAGRTASDDQSVMGSISVMQRRRPRLSMVRVSYGASFRSECAISASLDKRQTLDYKGSHYLCSNTVFPILLSRAGK